MTEQRVRDAEGCGRAWPDRGEAEPAAARPIAMGFNPWLSATPDTNVPDMDINAIVASAISDFERTKPSGERIFGEINKSITAFNVTLELGNATHFKGFTNTTLEGNFAAQYGEFGKRVAIMNNVKMYESFKKMIEEFKTSLKANDQEVFKALHSTAQAAGYTLAGGSYSKEVNDNHYRSTFDFMAYRYADIEGIMNRAMTEAGLDMDTLTDGQKVVELLEKKSDIDVKLFFEVQTMALEQAFKLAGGQRGKKGYYQEYSGERALWKGYGGDLISEGSGEQGGWENGGKNHKLAWRGLQEEESKLAKARADWQTAAAVTNGVVVAAASAAMSIGGCVPCAVALTMVMAGANTTIQAGTQFSSNRSDQAMGQIGLGLVNMGTSLLGSYLGGLNYFGGLTDGATAMQKFATQATQMSLQNSIGYAGSGFNVDENGSLGYKGPSRGSFYSTLATTGLSVAGAGINAGMGWNGSTALGVSGGMNAVSSGIQFNDDGSLQKEFNWQNFGAGMASTAASIGAGKLAMSIANDKIAIKEATRFASATTRSLVMGNANALAQTYSTQNFFSALGDYLGDEAAKSTNDSMPSTPVRETFGGAAALVALRPRREGSSTDTDTDPLGGAIDAGAAAFGRAASSAWSSFTGAVSSAWDGIKSAASSVWGGITNTFEKTVNFVSGNGFNTKAEVETIRNEINTKVADTMQLTPGYAAVANRMGGKLTNVDGNPAVMKPDGTFEFINEKDAIAAEGEMLGMQTQEVNQGDALAMANRFNDNRKKLLATYYGKDRGAAEAFIKNSGGTKLEKELLAKDLEAAYKEWHSGKMTQAEQAQLIAAGKAYLAPPKPGERSAIASFFHSITRGVFDSEGGRLSQYESGLPGDKYPGEWACNLASDVMLINKLRGKNYSVTDGYKKGVKNGAVRSTDTLVRDDAALAHALGANKNVKYYSSSEFSEASIKALLDQGTWVKINMPSTPHSQVIYDYETRNGQFLFKVHDPGGQLDTHISPTNWMPFKFKVDTRTGAEIKSYSVISLDDKRPRPVTSIGYYK